MYGVWVAPPAMAMLAYANLEGLTSFDAVQRLLFCESTCRVHVFPRFGTIFMQRLKTIFCMEDPALIVPSARHSAAQKSGLDSSYSRSSLLLTSLMVMVNQNQSLSDGDNNNSHETDRAARGRGLPYICSKLTSRRLRFPRFLPSTFHHPVYRTSRDIKHVFRFYRASTRTAKGQKRSSSHARHPSHVSSHSVVVPAVFSVFHTATVRSFLLGLALTFSSPRALPRIRIYSVRLCPPCVYLQTRRFR